MKEVNDITESVKFEFGNWNHHVIAKQIEYQFSLLNEGKPLNRKVIEELIHLNFPHIKTPLQDEELWKICEKALAYLKSDPHDDNWYLMEFERRRRLAELRQQKAFNTDWETREATEEGQRRNRHGNGRGAA